MRHLCIIAAFALAACYQHTDDGESGRSGESAAADPAVKLTGRVTDAAQVFGNDQEAILSEKLARLEQATKHQMVVVTVSSLNGRDIKDFAIDLGNAWGIGRKNCDDGVIILLAPNELKVRIAVGYGLESTLPDELCAEIIEDEMIPHFRKGDYYMGTEKGVDALIAALQ